MHKAVGFVRLFENILFISLLNPESRSLKDGPRRPPPYDHCSDSPG